MITGETIVYGVIGNPVAHSLSPVMHNQAFSNTGYPGVYLPFQVQDIGAAVDGIRALNVRGVSVTIPHKEAVMPYLDQIDDSAREIGAVNTVVNDKGRLIGYNTDAYGAVTALSEKTDIKNKDVVILGAGGAARAISYGVLKQGGRLHVLNRSAEKGERLAGFLGAVFYPMDRFDQAPCDILINTTPVGMHPEVDAMPVARNRLNDHMVVMDIIYNPVKTRLLEAAEAIGAQVISGVPMFVYQGARQFELWTGLDAPVDLMKEVVYEALNE
ncbi:MAG: shikimate dehydrogenase [Desulfobacterales bacterium]